MTTEDMDATNNDSVAKCRDCDHRFKPLPDMASFTDFGSWSIAMARWSKDFADHYETQHQITVPLLGAAAKRVLSKLN